MRTCDYEAMLDIVMDDSIRPPHLDQFLDEGQNTALHICCKQGFEDLSDEERETILNLMVSRRCIIC